VLPRVTAFCFHILSLPCGEQKSQNPAHMKTTASNNPMNRSSCPLVLLVIPLALGCFALLPQAQATCQQGCLTNSNTVLGDDALISLTTGFRNTAVGYQALFSNTTSPENTAIGSFALFSNTTGITNTAVGDVALSQNTTGSGNVAVGVAALIDNTTGFANTAIGSAALESNTIGNRNTATGLAALFFNTTGNQNTATGWAALNNNNGSNNIALGYSAGANLTAGDNNIDIGNAGVAGEAGVIRIGTIGTQTATFIAGIRGVPIVGGTEVGVNSSGQLGVRASSARYKEAIKPMDEASEAILALKPVTFRYKKEIDAARTPEFGLVAEDVEKVNPDLVARDEQGKPYTVRYEAVNAMLLNEFLKEHRTVQEQGATIAQQRRDFERAIAKQQKQIDALTVGLQKVSAQFEVSNRASQTVLNNR
jgi:hypothetical protein